MHKTGYRNPTNALQTAFQDAWKTPLHTFQWFGEHPKHLTYFNDYMALRRRAEQTWLTVYPVADEAAGWDARDNTRAVYVNIGGGVGHQCAQFKARYPHLPGRIVLQDLPHTVAHALPTPGVENMGHDFFEEQPIKGEYLISTRMD